jgi:hypothetical protein
MSNMNQPNTFDFRGVLDIQKDYLANLKTQSQDPNSAQVINTMQQNLSATHQNYVNSNISTDALLTNQEKVLNIVENEKKRLEDKKQSVDTVIFGQKRAVELNTSNRLRQQSYTNLLIIFILTLGAFVLIMVLSIHFTIIPQSVYDLLSIIIISVGIYFGSLQFLEIQSRSKMDYNKLDLATLNNSVSGNTLAGNTAARGTGNLLDLINTNGCVGSDCCGTGSSWDQGNSVCRATALINAFTTMDFAYNSGDLSKTNISANGPYEFSDYVPIK